jgi:hypothetical protein
VERRRQVCNAVGRKKMEMKHGQRAMLCRGVKGSYIGPVNLKELRNQP